MRGTHRAPHPPRRRGIWADLVAEPDEITRRLAELAEQIRAEALEIRRRQVDAFHGAR